MNQDDAGCRAETNGVAGWSGARALTAAAAARAMMQLRNMALSFPRVALSGVVGSGRQVPAEERPDPLPSVAGRIGPEARSILRTPRTAPRWRFLKQFLLALYAESHVPTVPT